MIRMSRLKVLMINAANVFPIPLIILSNVVLAYKKGHNQARVEMKSPAKVLLNNKFPAKLPNRTKPMQQEIPNKVHEMSVFLTIDFNDCL